MSKVSVILLAGGVGKRMGKEIPKQHLQLCGKPIIMHTIERLEKIDDIDEIIIPSPEKFMHDTSRIVEQYNIQKDVICIAGGKTRQESVYNGLSKAKNSTVIIHEAVRPLVSLDAFKKLIECGSENVTYALDIPFTVLVGKEKIEGILDRNSLLNIQLPQKYNKALLMKAHEAAKENGKIYTEDASLLFDSLNENVMVLKGFDSNIKITYPIDLIIAEEINNELFSGGR